MTADDVPPYELGANEPWVPVIVSPTFFWVPKKSTNPPRQHLLSVSPIVLDADCHGHKTPIEVEAKVLLTY